MSRAPVAWVFNLDAEDELKRGGPHTPSLATRARTLGLLKVLGQLMQPQDEVLWPGEPGPRAVQWGRAWCPTGFAVQQLARAGLRVPPAPSIAVLRRVNHRRFTHALGGGLPGARFVQTAAELTEALADARLLATVSREGNWLLKLPLGYAGRGRRKIAPNSWSAADRTWVQAALRGSDGLQVEPLVERDVDCSLHGWLGEDGALVLGEPTLQTIDASGTWQSAERAAPGVLWPLERDALYACAEETARALTAAGYFGPFGLDAFRWRAPDGALHFHPRCELNARYAMGWAVGMGDFEVPAEAW